MKTYATTARSASAFTLLELLIAVVAFAIVLGAINSVFYGAVRLRNKTVESIDAALPIQHALAIMRADLSNIVPPGGLFFRELQTTPTATTSSQSSGAGSMSMSAATQPGQSSPEFSTAAGALDETSPWADVQKVSYFLAASTNGGVGRDLFRSVQRNPIPSLLNEPVHEPLLTGVENIYFRYHDGTQWKETWDSTTEADKLPRAIKVQIALAIEERGRLQPPPIELVVPLLVDGGTNQPGGSP